MLDMCLCMSVYGSMSISVSTFTYTIGSVSVEKADSYIEFGFGARKEKAI